MLRVIKGNNKKLDIYIHEKDGSFMKKEDHDAALKDNEDIGVIDLDLRRSIWGARRMTCRCGYVWAAVFRNDGDHLICPSCKDKILYDPKEV